MIYPRHRLAVTRGSVSPLRRATHRLGAGLLQQDRRRFIGQCEDRGRNKIRMLQGIATAQHRMAACIRHGHPGTAGRERMQIFRPFFLKLLVHFEVIMETKHEQIVFRAAANLRAENG